jgi:hypothetical protein
MSRNGRRNRRGWRVGQNEGSILYLCGVEEFLVLREFYVQNDRAKLAPRYLFCVRFAGLVIGRGVKGHGLGGLD